MRIPLLVTADALSRENRWLLVSSLFTQRRSSVASVLAIGNVIVVCWLHTGWCGFSWLAAMAAAAAAVSFALNTAFAGFHRNDPALTYRGTPEGWACWHLVRVSLLAAVWGWLNLVLFLRFDDAGLQFFATTMEAAWLSGAAARNAVSPAGVLVPMLLVLLTMAIGAGFAGDHFARVVIPFLPIVFGAMLSITRFIGRQTVTSMLAEQRLAELNQQLTRLSTTDGLTGIGNRRCFDAAMHSVWATAIRDAAPVALLMLDVDHFKRYNDHYGHLQGDDCLRTVALCCGSVLQRPADLLTRYGGEEFAALLPATDLAGAQVVAEKLRRAVFEAQLPHLQSPLGRVSVSVGVASLSPTAGRPAEDLIALADQALYQAKRAGRNCTRSIGTPRHAEVCTGMGRTADLHPAG